MKRVLSLCDFWFGTDNFPRDDFIRQTMETHRGWMPVAALMTFPKMQKWVEEKTVVKAMVAAGTHRYEVSSLPDGRACFRRTAFGRAWMEAEAHRAGAVDIDANEEALPFSRGELHDWQALDDEALEHLHGELGGR